MPRTNIPLVTVDRSGHLVGSPTASDFTNGMYIEGNVDGHILFKIKNNNAGTQTVTFKAVRVVDDLPLTDLIVSLLTTEERLYWYFAPVTFNQTYNDGSSDHLQSILINPSVNTDLAINAYYMPNPPRAQ